MVNPSLQPFACRSCRSRILQSFAATFFDTPLHTQSQQRRFLPIARSLSHERPRLADDTAKATLSSDSTPNNTPTSPSKSAPPADAPPSSSANSSLPWYLQVSTPTPPPSTSAHPTSPRDLLPDLPPNPPSILSPILSHLSVDLGLDSLTLLDLRSLTNPPPALGANLIMILGTARSIKHLNVSADRLCRWLRSEYNKLRPYADGLLGRQELKVKLRRRERRRKLKASVGNMMGEMDERGGGDDGVTTGWICVNVGQVDDNSGAGQAGGSNEAVARTVQDVEEEEEEEEEYINPTTSSEAAKEEQDQDSDPIYIGFGSRSNAPRIVVQMFTEEKRAELDLEGLWQDRATRRTRKAERNDEEAEAAMQEREQSTNDESGFASMIKGGQASSSDSGSARAVAGG